MTTERLSPGGMESNYVSAGRLILVRFYVGFTSQGSLLECFSMEMEDGKPRAWRGNMRKEGKEKQMQREREVVWSVCEEGVREVNLPRMGSMGRRVLSGVRGAVKPLLWTAGG